MDIKEVLPFIMMVFDDAAYPMLVKFTGYIPEGPEKKLVLGVMPLVKAYADEKAAAAEASAAPVAPAAS